MNIFEKFREKILSCIGELVSCGVLPCDMTYENITVEVPRDKAHGEISSNVAMALSKQAKMRPQEIAKLIAELLKVQAEILDVSIAGPGFLNITAKPELWHRVIREALVEKDKFGSLDIGKSSKINIEFVSANPTGPLHIGHTRGAVFGDALAGLLTFVGFDVTKEYYINDGGAQIDVLARSTYLRYLEANGEYIEFTEGSYPGDYLIGLGVELKKLFGKDLVNMSEEEWLPKIREYSCEYMMKIIESDLALLGVKMDVFYSEKSLYGSGKIEEAIKCLEQKSLIYSGILDAPKGKLLDDWEPREQTLFRSTVHGDDVDRPVKKSDGGWTYFAPDIAYHHDKIQRGFSQLIDIFGADHSGYVKRMKAAVSALSDGKITLSVKLCQLVKLFRNGQPHKMSKRAGQFVTLRDIISEVGSDSVRFMMLTRKNDAPLDFDFAKSVEQSKDNPVFYVQYAHARCSSIIKKAAEDDILIRDTELPSLDLNLLSTQSEKLVIFKVSEWPRIIELAAKAQEPHRIVFYLHELAALFHSLQHDGKINRDLRFIVENKSLAQARLALVTAAQTVFAVGLGILGITPLQKM